ncbi:MAG: porin, partial [Sutterella sp.]
MKTLKLAALAAAMIAAGSLQAADVKIYGRTDAGLLYTNVKHGDDKLELKSGGRATNRFGFNIVEDLGNGWKAKGYLENGFKIDDGTLGTSNTLFDRRSILAVAGPYGEFGMGRAGTVQSTMAPYSMGALRFDPFATSYGNASIGKSFANSSRVNNGVHYVSPVMNGFKFGGSYSFGDSTDAAEWQDKAHTLALAANYQSPNLFVTLTFANIDQAHAASQKADARAYQLGGWYRVVPDFRVFAAAGYQTNWATGASFGSKTTDFGSALNVTASELNQGWKGTSAMLGMDYVVGKHKFIADVQFFDGELESRSDL